MTTIAPTPLRATVLADRLLGRSLALDALLIVGGVALIGAFSYLQIPLWPVPITGQTLAVLLVGSTLGAARGGISTALYAIVGLIGIPVFAPNPDGSLASGWQVISGPTGGYILGFVVAAVLVGLLAERRWDRKALKAIATFAAGSIAVFAVGLPWLALYLGSIGAPHDLESVLEAGLYPFLIGGAIKAAIAAGVLPLAWKCTQRIGDRRTPST